ncbi:Uncharacterised protein [Mycobacteroides abscessus subsp. abscessus]|nr:Uncharacterised protein [Mycobacteroides abscessus subsp. abscessus]SIK23024.1 Uncharacterised protein [Mycobacteroides abscessus subsp. abscessus]
MGGNECAAEDSIAVNGTGTAESAATACITSPSTSTKVVRRISCRETIPASARWSASRRTAPRKCRTIGTL